MRSLNAFKSVANRLLVTDTFIPAVDVVALSVGVTLVGCIVTLVNIGAGEAVTVETIITRTCVVSISVNAQCVIVTALGIAVAPQTYRIALIIVSALEAVAIVASVTLTAVAAIVVNA